MPAEPSPALDLAKVTESPNMTAGYDAARAGGAALVRGERLGGYDFWAVIGYDAAREAGKDTGGLVSGQGCTVPPLKTAVPAVPTELDPPEHLKYRRILAPALRPDRVERWSDVIRHSVDHAIDQFIESGAGDLVDIARHVPPTVIAAILGVPDDGPIMVGLTKRINQAAMRDDAEGRAAINRELMDYLEAIVTAAEGTDRQDMLGLIANATIDGKPIDHVMALATTLTVIIAGQETTVNGIASILALLGANQHAKRQLVQDPTRIPAAVEEALRLEAPVQMMGRTAAADLEIDGCPIKKGEKVGIVWGAANLDPAKFDSPSEFRLDRDANPHVAFGHGIHRCVGEHLARAEMLIATQQVLARMPDFELAGEVKRGTNTAWNRGVLSMPVTFTPGRRMLADGNQRPGT